MRIQSWGGMSGEVASLIQPAFSSDLSKCITRPQRAPRSKCLVIGNLRSYGDQVLSVDGRYVQTTRCDRIIDIDRENDTITAESGISIDAIQRRIAPLGYMLPVTPGTAFLTLGGAIANDVHGKNHHVAGTFGCHVERFELVRSTGEVMICSAADNQEWFSATIGGMGLTGAITWATVRLRRVSSLVLEVRSQRFRNLGEFFQLDAMNKASHEYTVAWIDCMTTGKSLGRGIFSVADPTPGTRPTARCAPPDLKRTGIPVRLPVAPVNRLSLALMNALYYRLHPEGTRHVHYQKWMYPLDSIRHWNRLYGHKGFRQFQCVVPLSQAPEAISEMLEIIAAARQRPFLAVLKNFGHLPSPGLMSFPMPGTTLALDFANRGAATDELLLRLHGITAAAGGRLYAAKDAGSPVESLASAFPNYARFKRMIDPGIGSLLAQRLRLLG